MWLTGRAVCRQRGIVESDEVGTQTHRIAERPEELQGKANRSAGPPPRY